MIDFHLHVFPDKLAKRVLELLSHNSGGVEPVFDGTLTGLRSQMIKDGIDSGVVLMIATKPEQETAINRFAIDNNNDHILFFGSVHPRSKNVHHHLKMLQEAGIKGIKLHPEYQNFSIDDPELFPLYEKLAEMGFITVFHTGLDIGYDTPCHCRPKALASILPVFQGAPVVAAHFGGYMLWEEVERELIGKPVYMDTSYCQSHIPAPLINRLIREHGADRVLFGSDAPWSKPRLEISLINNLDLTDSEKEAIFDGNARRLLGLPAKST
jgi:predicted TIM-barrel fold metal-dependent hydrolase